MSDKTRWEFSKARSKYHFDNFKNEDQNPPYKIVGHVPGNHKDELFKLMERQEMFPSNFINRMNIFNYDQKPFTFDYDAKEMEFLGLDIDKHFFNVLKIESSEYFKTIAATFGMTKLSGKIHVQKPGQMFPYHIDELPHLKDNQEEHWLDEKPEMAARFEIQLLDWVPGQVWTYGNTYWKQWRSGEIAFHDWRDVPHGTANISRSIRASLQVTGMVTDKTLDIIRNGYK